MLAWRQGLAPRWHRYNGTTWTEGPALTQSIRGMAVWSAGMDRVLVRLEDGAAAALRLSTGEQTVALSSGVESTTGFRDAAGTSLCTTMVTFGGALQAMCIQADDTVTYVSLSGGARELAGPIIPIAATLVMFPERRTLDALTTLTSIFLAHTVFGYQVLPGISRPGSLGGFAGFMTRAHVRRDLQRVAYEGAVEGLDGGAMVPAISVHDVMATQQLAFEDGQLVSGASAEEEAVEASPGPALIRSTDGMLRAWSLEPGSRPGPALGWVTPDARAHSQRNAAAVFGVDGTPAGSVVIMGLPEGNTLWTLNDGCGVSLGVRAMHEDGRAVVFRRTGTAATGFSFVRPDCRTDFPLATTVENARGLWINQDDDGVHRLYQMTAEGELSGVEIPWPHGGSPAVLVEE